MSLPHTRILVIDDEPMFRSLIVALLRKDYLVSVASEGSEGFYKALAHPPDLAIVDIQMPGWDGLRTLRAFRGHPALSGTKIMMLTADASRETVLAAIREGASDYMIKASFSKEELREKVEKLVADGCHPPEPGPPPPSARPAAPHMAALAAHEPGDAGAALQQMIDGWE